MIFRVFDEIETYGLKSPKSAYGKNEICFWNPYKILTMSSEGLVSKLHTWIKHLPRKYFYTNDEKFNLMLQKGIYPYEYMDSFGRFNEIELLSKEDFYDKLNNKNISDKDYEHAQNVWKTFDLKNMGDYHDLYMETDVLLLADVVENFREVSIKDDELDPLWYITLAGLAWDSMLKLTKQKLQVIPDEDMYLFIERCKRSGIV